MKREEKFFTFLICILAFSFLIFNSCQAAILYLEPSMAEYKVGEIFVLENRIDLEPNENINVVEVNLKYPKDLLEVIDLSFGNSILTVIPHQPIINRDEGTISFAGGIIGGYTGQIPGDPGKSNLLAKIIFKSKDIIKGSGKIEFLETSQVLLNDGLGTPTKLTLKSALINISEDKPLIVKNEWQEELEKDKIPPESFEIKIQNDPSIFDGKYFIVFFTTDKQTGIDHYEVSETKNKDKENWQRAESPYLLADQTLKSFIKVKAIDKAGNQRIEILPPKTQKNWLDLIITLIIFLIVFFILYLLRKKVLITKK